MTLTIDEIKDLAQLAGFRIEGAISAEDSEVEITIEPCPERGVIDDHQIIHCRFMAYWEEYPEEGVMPLGKPLDSVNQNTAK